jgi:dihydroflavonol-4-reductase
VQTRGVSSIDRRPAREGTRRVLEASHGAGVKRVVITSSTAAAMPPKGGDATSDETAWTDLPDKPAYNYPRAKTLAEQDAWAFVGGAGRGLELATVLPSQIQGPVLGADYSPSVEIIAMMLKGKMPAAPRIGFSIVDVRDLVDLHIRAMTAPEAAGQRFVAAGDFLWFSDIARLLRGHLGEQGAKAPSRIAPDFLVRFGALFNPEAAQLVPNLGVKSRISSAKAERLLGWRPRPAEESVLDAARSLIARGLV